jgi:hypothetical protein
MGTAQLAASVSLPALTSKPLSVQQSGARYLEPQPCRGKSLDRFEVEGFGLLGVSE